MEVLEYASQDAIAGLLRNLRAFAQSGYPGEQFWKRQERRGGFVLGLLQEIEELVDELGSLFFFVPLGQGGSIHVEGGHVNALTLPSFDGPGR
jgi:hypothetical protein